MGGQYVFAVKSRKHCEIWLYSFEEGYVFDRGHTLCDEFSPKYEEAVDKPWQPDKTDDAAVANQMNNSLAQPGGGDGPAAPQTHAGCQSVWMLGDGVVTVTLELSEGAFVDQPL